MANLGGLVLQFGNNANVCTLGEGGTHCLKGFANSFKTKKDISTFVSRRGACRFLILVEAPAWEILRLQRREVSKSCQSNCLFYIVRGRAL